MKLKSVPRVSIDAKALEKVWQWTALAKGEFSCLAMVTNDLHVHDVQLFDQVNTAASTELDQGALAKFLVHHPAPELVRCHIHSHGSLQVFWSQQDEACFEGLETESFLVAIVVNKRHELKCRLDIWKPFRLTLDDLALEVRLPRYELKGECEQAFARHVTELQPVVSRWTSDPRQPGPAPSRNLGGWPGWDDEDLAVWGGER